MGLALPCASLPPMLAGTVGRVTGSHDQCPRYSAPSITQRASSAFSPAVSV